MGATIREFFVQHPFSEQIGVRLGHLVHSLRFERVEQLVELINKNGLSDSVFFVWGNDEFIFLAFSIYQLLLVLGVSSFL